MRLPTTKKGKRIAALVLAAGVGAIWIPQVVSAMQKRKAKPPTEVQAVGALSGESGAPVTPTQTRGPAESAAVSEGGADRLSDFERSLARVEAALPESTKTDLSVLATAWSRASDSSPETPEVRASPRDATETLETRSSSDVEEFLSTHPLNGLLVGSEKRLARLGPLLVAEGDEPIPGVIRVIAIRPREVELDVGGRRRCIPLAPFQVRPVPRPSGNPTPASGAEPPPAQDGKAPAATSPAPATPVPAEDPAAKPAEIQPKGSP